MFRLSVSSVIGVAAVLFSSAAIAQTSLASAPQLLGTVTGHAPLAFDSQHRPRWVTQPENFYVIKRRKDAQFDLLRKKMGKEFLSEEGTGYGQYQQWVNYWEPKLYPHGDFRIALQAMAQIPNRPVRRPLTAQQNACSGWKELGPTNMPQGTSIYRGIGQVDWITLDPSNPANVFTGSAAGGLFVSTDSASTWKPGGTDFISPNIGAAHVAIDPNDSDRWFLATGAGDGLNDNSVNVSHGVYRTADRGANWDYIGLDLSPWFWPAQIKKLLIAPNDSNTVYAATSVGLFRTSNALANFALVTWQPLIGGGSNASRYYDVEYKPGSTSTLYASGTTVMRSTDSGNTWNQLPGIPFLGADVVRIALEVTPANPDYLYAVVVEKGPAACFDNNNTSRLYRFDAGSQSWTDKGPICGTGYYPYPPDQNGVNSSRAHSIGVSPVDANLIFIGDVGPIVRCTTGGDAHFCVWIPTTNTVHTDIHQVKFTPDGSTAYAATDGGVFKTIDGGATWTPQMNALNVARSEMSTMSTSATDPTLILNGLFDDGTVLYKNNTWTHVLQGDGLTPIIDHVDPKYMYATSQGGVMFRSDDTGASFLNNNVSIPCSGWPTMAVLNSVNTATIFAAQSPRSDDPSCQPGVVRSTTRGGNWTPISSFTAGGFSGYSVWKLYTAPSNPDYLYAYLVPTSGAAPAVLMRTTNANDPNPSNVTWQAIPHPSNQWISAIDVDEADPNRFWVTYAGLTPATEKVFYYDGSWHNVTTNLVTNFGNISVYSIVHERGSDRLFIGTDIGVYSGEGISPNWTRVGGIQQGELPYVEVTNLQINYVDNKLRAATYGRGTWEIALDPCLPTVPGPDAIIEDSAVDVGNQPNMDSGTVLWDSQDIWVRNTPDHMFTYAPIPPRFSNEQQHENPEYSSIPGNAPFIYAKVHNRGTLSVSGTVHFYWANASTGLDWQLPDWTEITPQLSSSTHVVNLTPGGIWVVSLQWQDIPNPVLSTGGHFCLLARFVADVSTPDPIVGETTGNGVWGNVYNSSKIAWKNVTVVDQFQNRDVGGQVIVRNISRIPSQTQLRFDVAGGGEDLFRTGGIKVDLGKELFAIWLRGGQRGSGVKVIGRSTITLVKSSALLSGLVLSPREEHVVTFHFPVAVSDPKQHGYKVNVTQLDLAKSSGHLPPVTGGETFVIRRAIGGKTLIDGSVSY